MTEWRRLSAHDRAEVEEWELGLLSVERFDRVRGSCGVCLDCGAEVDGSPDVALAVHDCQSGAWRFFDLWEIRSS